VARKKELRSPRNEASSDHCPAATKRNGAGFQIAHRSLAPPKEKSPNNIISTAHWPLTRSEEKEHGYTDTRLYSARNGTFTEHAVPPPRKKTATVHGAGLCPSLGLTPLSPRIITNTVRLGNCEVHRTNFNPSLHGCLAKAQHGSKNKASTAHWPAKSGHGCKVAHCTERDPYCTFFAIAPEKQNATVHRARF